MSSNIPWANSWHSLRWGRPLDERVWGWRSVVQFWVSWGLGSITMFVGGCLSREWELNVLHIACVCNHLFYSTPLFSVLVFFVRSFTEIFSIRENRVLWSLGVNFLLALPLLLTSCLLHYWLNWKSTGTHNLGTLFFFLVKYWNGEVLGLLVQSLSRIQLFAAPWIVAHRAPLSVAFSRQEHWSGLP